MNPTASAPSTQLRHLQEWFQSVVTAPEGLTEDGTRPATSVPAIDAAAIDQVLTRSSHLSAAERLAVYTNAYTARLVDCLEQMFPVLGHTLGEEIFREFARDYLQIHPSRNYTLSTLGERFPAFLADTCPPRESGAPPDWADFMVDLATLEWIIYEVFDGPGTEDAPGPVGGALQNLPPERWSELRLVTAPCLRLARFRFPVNDYYTACRRLSAEEECPSMPDPIEEHVAISRVNYVVRRYPLDAVQHRILQSLTAGKTLGEALEDALAEAPDPDPAMTAAALSSWFELWQRERFFLAATIR
jgi:hypothetical protein